MKGKKIVALAAASAVLCSVSFCGCTFIPKDDSVAQAVLIKPQKQEFTTDKVKKGTVKQAVTGSGTLTPFNSTNLSFSGQNQRVKSIKVKAGDNVKKGQVLITGESDELDSSIKDASYDIQKAEIDYNRKTEKLGALKAANKDSEAIKDAEVEIKIASLSLQQSKDKLQKLKKDSENLTVTAPYDGTITFVEDIKEGESAIGFKTLATIADPAKMQVVYQGNEQEINKLKLGMPVEISYSNKSYTGKVAMTKENSPKEDADKFKQNVVISFDKMPESVKIGATASVSIVLAKKDNTLIVPKTAVKEYSGSCSVSVLDNGRKRDVPVQIGIKGDTIYEVVSGLTEGQEVIIG